MKYARKAVLAWVLFGLITAIIVVTFSINVTNGTAGDNLLGLLVSAAWGLVPVTFALVGALIISRQARNVIGLLLMLPAVTFAIPVDSFLAGFAAAPLALVDLPRSGPGHYRSNEPRCGARVNHQP